jgi:predicted nuclease of predicted toxin-antitoxin system
MLALLDRITSYIELAHFSKWLETNSELAVCLVVARDGHERVVAKRNDLVGTSRSIQKPLRLVKLALSKVSSVHVHHVMVRKQSSCIRRS